MRAGKTTHIFQLGEHSIRFSGNFDSGNLRNVLQLAPFEYQLEAAVDSYEFTVSNKAFFHFFVEGCPEGQTLNIVFRNLALLNTLREDAKRYRPFISTDGINYRRLNYEQVEILQQFDSYTLRIRVQMRITKTYFSFALPYSYERYLNMVRDLPDSNEELQVSKEVLCYSNNLNLVYVITITSKSRFLEAEERVCENSNGIILPEKHLHPPRKYCDKPVILISSRVHPGQTTSSWAVEGIIKFIIGDSDDAKSLRKHFQIVIVPMLNPDGVEEGLYRLDTKGHNLNRYYLVSDNRQPSIYCMKHLIRHYHETKRLLYYFDFHGHPSQKGSFLYGNAIDDLPFQAETELFGRLLAILCPTFQQKCCIFDRQQMNSKDKHDLYTKEGCARVFTFKLSNIIHSYTIELGFHGLSDCNSTFLYDQQQYYSEGRSIMEAVLISSSLKEHPIHKLPNLRKQLVLEICTREERFRKEERHLQHKKQHVNEIVENQYWRNIHDQYFPQISKTKRNLFRPSKHQLKFQKKDSFSSNFQSFCSQEAVIQKPVLQNRESEDDRTSLADMLDEKPMKLEPKHMSFKLQRTTNSFESTKVSSKGEIEEKIFSRQLIKLPPKPISLKEDQSVGVFKERLKSLKKPIALRSIEQAHTHNREQEHLFSDFNIREARIGQYVSVTRPVTKSNFPRNKIHSLFIETHY